LPIADDFALLDDKITRLYATTPMFEAGSVLFPKQAPWLDELINELLVD